MVAHLPQHVCAKQGYDNVCSHAQGIYLVALRMYVQEHGASGERDYDAQKEGKPRVPEQADTDNQVNRAQQSIGKCRRGKLTQPQRSNLTDTRQAHQCCGCKAQ